MIHNSENDNSFLLLRREVCGLLPVGFQFAVPSHQHQPDKVLIIVEISRVGSELIITVRKYRTDTANKTLKCQFMFHNHM